MSLNNQTKTKIFSKNFILTKLYIQTPKKILITAIYSLIGIGIYLLVSLIPIPYIVVGFFRFSFIFSIAIIPVLGAIRGPLAGFFTGFIGTLLCDLLSYQVILGLTLPYISYGLLGFIVGLAKYQLNNGKSLVKLSLISLLSFILSTILLTIIALTILNISLLVELGFVILPLLSMGIPTIILLTPLYARLWYFLEFTVYPFIKAKIVNLTIRDK